MFNNLGRVITTMFIWGIALILSIMCFYLTAEEGLPALFSLAALITILGMTTFTTSIVWRNAGQDKTTRPKTVQIPVNINHQSSKAKRSEPSRGIMPSLRDEKLALLYELMDDDERRAFKRALQNEYLGQRSRAESLGNLIDGELPFDDPYFEQDEDDFRRRR